MEDRSAHPLAKAIIKAAAGLPLPAVGDFKSLTGRGLAGLIDGKPVLVGSAAYLKLHDISLDAFTDKEEELRGRRATVIYVSHGDAAIGMIAVLDPVRQQAQNILAELSRSGLSIIMATGDDETTAQAVAHEAGLHDVRSRMMPQSKATLVQEIQKRGRVVAFAGDGVNDAPALAVADVAIAMGSGSDAAIASAGLVLLKGDLTALLRARHLAKATLGNMKQNLAFAFAYNLLGVPLAAGVLYPFTGWLLSPMIAAAAMSFSSVSVIANALRLKGAKL
jgi:Cu+-exporting ATPase